MSKVVTVDAENRLHLPAEVRDWFPPGARFVVAKEGDTVTLRRVDGLAAYLAAVEATEDAAALSLDEIKAEIEAYRREKA